MQNLLQDLRYGLRTLRKNAGFTAVAVLSLALGIGANTAIFQLLDAVRLRTLPVNNPRSSPSCTWRTPQASGTASRAGLRCSRIR